MTSRDTDRAATEAIVKDALSSVAVAAFARGIGLFLHVDHRLPATVSGDAAAVTDYLRRGLARTIEAGRTRTIALALPLRPDPDAPPYGDQWRPAFEGRSMLHVGDALLDAGRFCASLAAIGLEVALADSPEAALKRARARAEAGRPFDLVLIDALPVEAAEDLARAFRADPRLADTLITFAGVGKDEEATPLGEVPLFDAARSPARPWRRLIEVMRELIEAREHRAAPRPAAQLGAPGLPDLGGRRLLVAEDVETNRVLLRAFLEPTGAAVETVACGEAAVERHAAEPADLVLMDLQMPGVDGITAARRIRALPPPAGEVPIVAL